MNRNELPSIDDGKAIFDYAKRYGCNFLMDSMFLSTAKIIGYKAKTEKTTDRSLLIIANQLFAEAKLIWANHRDKGMTVWYQVMIQCYMAEASIAFVQKKNSAERREGFVTNKFSVEHEKRLIEAITKHASHDAYVASLRPVE